METLLHIAGKEKFVQFPIDQQMLCCNASEYRISVISSRPQLEAFLKDCKKLKAVACNNKKKYLHITQILG